MLTNNAQVQRVALFQRLMWKHLKEWQACKVQHHMHAYVTLQYLHSRYSNDGSISTFCSAKHVTLCISGDHSILI